MKRKIVKWEAFTPPVEWHAILECGHKSPPGYDGNYRTDAEQKALALVGEDECVECSRIELDAQALEKRASALRAQLSRTAE